LRLISRAHFLEQIAPTSAGKGQNKPDLFFAYGFVVANGWIVQNPNINGYSGAFGYNLATPEQWTTQRKLMEGEIRESLAMYPALERIDPDRSFDQVGAAQPFRRRGALRRGRRRGRVRTRLLDRYLVAAVRVGDVLRVRNECG
jgi:hypothetical protein